MPSELLRRCYAGRAARAGPFADLLMVGQARLVNDPVIPLPFQPDVPTDLRPAPELPVLRDSELEGLSIDGVDWRGWNAQGLRLSESSFRSAELSDASLSRCRFRDLVVLDGSWANVEAIDASFTRVRFERVRLTGANFSGSTLDDVTFVDCRLDLCSFRLARLDRVLFDSSKLTEVDLYEAVLTSATFVDCDLTGATLTHATFDRSELRGCDLSSVHSPEQLRGVRMPWADVIRSAGELAAAAGIEVIE